MNKLRLVIFSSLMIFSVVTFAEKIPENTRYEVCFTPGGDCTTRIISKINASSKSVYVQAYSFTSAPIAKALVNAKHRGVDVKVILDKSQIKNNKYSSAQYFINQHIPLWIDYKPAIAHNKVMILDSNTVITGSFNFTKAAQVRNAENLLIIRDHSLAKLYLNNWQSRKAKSRFVEEPSKE